MVESLTKASAEYKTESLMFGVFIILGDTLLRFELRIGPFRGGATDATGVHLSDCSAYRLQNTKTGTLSRRR
jgi:hypothetical protein